MACTLSNKCAKNLSKRTVLLQLIIKNVVTCFFLEHSVACVATADDPRFKLIAFESTPTNGVRMPSGATVGVMRKHQRTTATMEGNDSPAATPCNSTESSKPLLWAKFDSASVATPADVMARQTDSVQLELDQYVAQAPISHSSCPIVTVVSLLGR